MWDLTTRQAIRRLEGHVSHIISVTFSPDGQMAMSGGVDEVTILWDLNTGQAVRRFGEQQGFIRSVNFTPDGRLALTSANNALLLWDVGTGEIRQQFLGHTAEIIGAAISPDGTTALSGGRDGAVYWWDLQAGGELKHFQQPGQVAGLGFSPDGRYAVVNMNTDDIFVWDLLDGAKIRHFSGYVNNVGGLAISKDGRLALTSAWGEGLIIWRLDYLWDDLLQWVYTNRYVPELTCAERDTYRIPPECTADQSAPTIPPLVTIPPQTSVAFTILPSDVTIEPPLDAPVTPTTTPVYAGIALPNSDNRGQLAPGNGQSWSFAAKANESIALSVIADNPVNDAFLQTGQPDSNLLDTRVLVYAPDGTLQAENDDILNGTLSDSWLKNLILPVTGLYTVEVRSYGDQTGGNYTLRLEPVTAFDCLTIPIGGIWSLVITADGKYAVTGSGVPNMDDPSTTVKDIIVWDLSTRSEILRFSGHAERVHTLAITPDGNQVLSAAFYEKRPTLWSRTDGNVIAYLEPAGSEPPGYITYVAISLDGRAAVAAFTDGTVIIWDLSPASLGQTRRRMEHGIRIGSVVFSPDGRTLLSASSRRLRMVGS